LFTDFLFTLSGVIWEILCFEKTCCCRNDFDRNPFNRERCITNQFWSLLVPNDRARFSSEMSLEIDGYPWKLCPCFSQG
jgi:hypothetical protein